MFNKTLLFFTLLLSVLPTVSMAKSPLLIEGCVELINIYKSSKEQRLLAAQTTSLSESLRAGYCLGVLDQYAKTEYRCRSDWFKRAKFIATYSLEEHPPTEDKLLELSCEV